MKTKQLQFITVGMGLLLALLLVYLLVNKRSRTKILYNLGMEPNENKPGYIHNTTPNIFGKVTRGIRNNNPGNLRISPTDWKGEVPSDDKAFEQFDTMLNGIRAMLKLTQNYQTIHKLKTVRGIINRYAPPIENNTSSYVANVSAKVGVGPDEPIDLKDEETAVKFAIAVFESENSVTFPAEQIREAFYTI